MSHEIQFETPENVQVAYRIAGAGTRFIAWFVDCIVVWVVTIVVAIPLIFLFSAALEKLGSYIEIDQPKKPEDVMHIGMYVIGIAFLFYSFSGYLYFGLSELLMRGQTVGKRLMKIRVVKANGFSLDAVAIFVRTFFRVIDHLPPLWIVPVFTARSQRIGDLVAGTIVVADEQSESIGVRELANRSYADCRFHFDVTALGRLRPQDIRAIEAILEQWSSLSDRNRQALLDRLMPPLVNRLKVEGPAVEDQLQFLEDLLSAEYRRQYRKLG